MNYKKILSLSDGKIRTTLGRFDDIASIAKEQGITEIEWGDEFEKVKEYYEANGYESGLMVMGVLHKQ